MSNELSANNTATPENLSVMPKSDNKMLGIFSDNETFMSALRMAESLSESTIIPKSFQKNPSNCLIAIEMATRINTSPMMVMQNLYVVNGNPSWSSQWIIAMINNSKKYKNELQFEYGHDEKDGGLSCYAWAENYNGHITKGPKITMNMANSEGWVQKAGSKWKTMPEVMIMYRAASFFGRINCPNMILGIYSQEEVIDMDGNYNMGEPRYIVDGETGELVETDGPNLTIITKEQRQELFSIIRAKYDKEKANVMLRELVAEEGFGSTAELTVDSYERIIAKISEMNEDQSTDNK